MQSKLDARILLEQGIFIDYSLSSDSYYVRSKCTPECFHHVKQVSNDWSCDCGDYLNNRTRCKHIWAVILSEGLQETECQDDLQPILCDATLPSPSKNQEELNEVQPIQQLPSNLNTIEENEKIASNSSGQTTKNNHVIDENTFKSSRPVKVRKTYSQDWEAYNAAQKEEIQLFDTLLKDLVESIQEPKQTMGRPRLPLSESLFCAIQKVYSQLSSRRAHGLYKNSEAMGKIDHTPHFNAPSKLFNNPKITPVLQELVTLSSLPLVGLENSIAVDSTGFRTTIFGAYYDDVYGQKRKHRWLKAHIAVGINTHVVTSIVITDEHGADSPQFKSLVLMTAEHFDIREIYADRAYLSRDNLDVVGGIGGTPYIPFKKNVTYGSKGSDIWEKMNCIFYLHRDEFMSHYCKRNNIESTIAAIKRKLSETLRSKNPTAQVNELLAKIIAYNLTVIIHEMYDHGIEPDFLQIMPENYAHGQTDGINGVQSTG